MFHALEFICLSLFIERFTGALFHTNVAMGAEILGNWRVWS